MIIKYTCSTPYNGICSICSYDLSAMATFCIAFFFFFCCCCCFSFQHKSPDYSAVYIVFKTDEGTGKEGHGLTFTLGRGNELGTQPIQ